jgi:hypothetical protein
MGTVRAHDTDFHEIEVTDKKTDPHQQRQQANGQDSRASHQEYRQADQVKVE